MKLFGKRKAQANLVDLHMHTVYSDGQATPQELLEGARRKGLRTVAITDHETAQGSRDARRFARALDLELIPGIEITVSWQGYTGHGGGPDIDILGYFIDVDSPRLAQHEYWAQDAYGARAARVCEHLKRDGLALSKEDVLETNKTYPGFMAIVRTLRDQGLAPSQDVAARLIEPAWNAQGIELGIADAIALVHDLGGVAVLAHPAIIRRQDFEPLNERGMAMLVEMGLDGVEVLHYRNNAQQRRYFSLLANMFDLVSTGGSDEHGGPGAFSRLGSEAVTSEMLAALRAAQEKRHRLSPVH